MSTPRPVSRVIQAHTQQEGGGFIVRRPFPAPGLVQIDPFLLLDEMGPVDYAPGRGGGRARPSAPRVRDRHLHARGRDASTRTPPATAARIGPGDVQWMTAGAGVVHSEMPLARDPRARADASTASRSGSTCPRADKMTRPRYQEIPARGIPEARSADGLARVRVIAGEALGVQGGDRDAHADRSTRTGRSSRAPASTSRCRADFTASSPTCSMERCESATGGRRGARRTAGDPRRGRRRRSPLPRTRRRRRGCCCSAAFRSASRSRATARSS